MERWLRQVATEFWRSAGGPEPFPRSMEAPILRGQPLAILKIPKLLTRHVEEAMRRVQIECPLATTSRGLHGCLVAFGGHGIIFVDATDPLPEQVFTLAHETAHFLVDYQRPRTIATERLGEGILEVLDRRREPSRVERVDALLANAPSRLHVHLIARDDMGEVPESISVIESAADVLAIELIAPEDVVRDMARGRRRDDVVELLVDAFGLPRERSVAYARAIVPDRPAPLREWLGL